MAKKDACSEGGMEAADGGRDGRRDGRRNVTDGSCLARTGRERRGWHHRVRAHTHARAHTQTIAHIRPVCQLTPLMYILCCQECFRCLPVCQENVNHMTNRQIDGERQTCFDILFAYILFSALAINLRVGRTR